MSAPAAAHPNEHELLQLIFSSLPASGEEQPLSLLHTALNAKTGLPTAALLPNGGDLLQFIRKHSDVFVVHSHGGDTKSHSISRARPAAPSSSLDEESPRGKSQAPSKGKQDPLVQAVRAVLLARGNRVALSSLPGVFKQHHGKTFEALAGAASPSLLDFVRQHTPQHFSVHQDAAEGGAALVSCTSTVAPYGAMRKENGLFTPNKPSAAGAAASGLFTPPAHRTHSNTEYGAAAPASAPHTRSHHSDAAVLQLLYDILSPSESGLLAAQIGVALIERGCTRFHRDSGERAVPFMQHYPELMEFVPGKHEHFPLVRWIGPPPPPAAAGLPKGPPPNTPAAAAAGNKFGSSAGAGGYSQTREFASPHKVPYRVIPCIHWQRGSCTFGDRCTFRHDDASTPAHGGFAAGSPAGAPSSYPSGSYPPNRGTVACRHWTQRGRCHMDERCNFRHDPEARGSERPALANEHFAHLSYNTPQSSMYAVHAAAASAAAAGPSSDISMQELASLRPAEQARILDSLRHIVLANGNHMSLFQLGQQITALHGGWAHLSGLSHVKLGGFISRHVPEYFRLSDVDNTERGPMVSVVLEADGSMRPSRVLAFSEGSPIKFGMPFRLLTCKFWPGSCQKGDTCGYRHVTPEEAALAAGLQQAHAPPIAKKLVFEGAAPGPVKALPSRAVRSETHAAESDRLQLILQRAIQGRGGVLTLGDLQSVFAGVAHTPGFSDVQHGLAQFLLLHPDVFVLQGGAGVPSAATDSPLTRVLLTPAAVEELTSRDAEDAECEFEQLPPAHIPMDPTLPAYGEWYHTYGPGSAGKPRPPPRGPEQAASIKSIGGHPPVASVSASGHGRAHPSRAGSADEAVVRVLEGLLQRAGRPLMVWELGDRFKQATGLTYTDYAAQHGSQPAFIRLLQSHRGSFELEGPTGSKMMVHLARESAAAGTNEDSSGLAAQMGALAFSPSSKKAPETGSWRTKDTVAASGNGDTGLQGAASAAAAPAKESSAVAAASAPSVTPRTIAVLVHGAGSAKGIRCRVENVAVLRNELAAQMEERELSPLPEGVRFSTAAAADAQGRRTELTDAELWNLADGSAVYVVLPAQTKVLRVFMPPSYSDTSLQCAADELSDLPKALGEQLQAAGGCLFDERVQFSTTKPTAAAPSPLAVSAAEYAALSAGSALFAVFEWCAAPLSVQRLLLGGAEPDPNANCPVCNRLIAHQAHLKP